MPVGRHQRRLVVVWKDTGASMNYEDLPKGKVLCRGCYDVLHIGHIKHLKEAEMFGEVIVCVTPDEHAGRILRFTGEERVEHLEMLGYKAAVSPHKTAIGDLETFRPSHYCKGREFEALYDEIDAAEDLGIYVAFVGEKIASSRALRDEVRCPDQDVYYTYTIRCDRRDKLAGFLHMKGVETKVQHPLLLPQHDAFPRTYCPNGEQLVQRILSLPCHEKMSYEQQDWTISKVREFYK